jgi:hypothetical protein
VLPGGGTSSLGMIVTQSVWAGVTETFTTVMAGVIYFELKRIKEGDLHGQLEAVFG